MRCFDKRAEKFYQQTPPIAKTRAMRITMKAVNLSMYIVCSSHGCPNLLPLAPSWSGRDPEIPATAREKFNPYFLTNNLRYSP